jgi:hypothetical protein
MRFWVAHAPCEVRGLWVRVVGVSCGADHSFCCRGVEGWRGGVSICQGGRVALELRHNDAGWSSSVARWAHNPEVAGSNPAPATKLVQVRGSVAGDGGRALIFLSAVCPRDRATRCGRRRASLVLSGMGDGPSLACRTAVSSAVEPAGTRVPAESPLYGCDSTLGACGDGGRRDVGRVRGVGFNWPPVGLAIRRIVPGGWRDLPRDRRPARGRAGR